MSSLRFILASLTHHWRINLAVALGVFAATAVLTGALLVGDSVRGSLKTLTLDRLGKIDEALIADRFFRAELAAELAAKPEFKEHYSAAVPAIVFPRGTVERREESETRRAAGILVVGCGEDFWKLGRSEAAPRKLPGPGQIVLNEPLASELGISRADVDGGLRVTLRFPKLKQVSGESPLGRKADESRALPELEVVDVIPPASLGRFSLHPSQNLPRNAYINTASLQEALEQENKVNAIFVSGREAANSAPPDARASRALATAMRPTLADYGFSLKHVKRSFKSQDGTPEETIFDYYSFSTERMMLDRAAETTAGQAFSADHAQGVLTYLANAIEKIDSHAEDAEGKRVIPYSTVTAIDSIPTIGPLLGEKGEPLELADDEIALTSWAADDLAAKPGDEIAVSFFEPERTHGDARERTERFKLKSIIPLTEPARPYGRRTPATFTLRPTLANDPELTPEVPGVTDQQSIADWDAPFPFDYKRLKGQDDQYWNNHRTTPKAYISLAAGQRIWGSRFGQLTSYRIPAREGLSEEALAEKFLDQAARDGAALGLSFQPIKRDSLRASSGATPFDALFLSLSFFIIAAALLLVSLLFQLGIEQRASEVGILLALGLTRRKATRLFVVEGAFVAALGGLAGVAGGIAYAWLMLVGLRTIWLGAVVTPFLELHIGPASLAIGYSSSLVISVLTIAWSIRQTRRVSERQLLAGRAMPDVSFNPKPAATVRRVRISVAVGSGFNVLLPPILVLCAIGLAALATQLGGEAQAGAFMGAGAAVLGAALLFVSSRLKSAGTGRGTRGGFALAGLAVRNGARNPGRSTLTIGLIAAASFLIVAVSAFRLDPTDEGAGGFDLVAESGQPIYESLNTKTGRKEMLANGAALLEGGNVFGLRLQPGDDASCNNLYQAARPRVLGVTPEFIEHFDEARVKHFAWAGSAAKTKEEKLNPWRVLATRDSSVATSGSHVEGGSTSGPLVATDDSAIPVVLDKNTAMYSLKLYRGIGERFTVEYEDGTQITFRVAGLLANSILQGSLIISEEDFKRKFPRVSGYRYFLVHSPAGESVAVSQMLEERLSDQGFDATDTHQLLVDLLAVQNTYLSTFQALGGLGLLLGTFGLAAVQARSVLERRGELALLRAAGFRRRRLAGMVLLENLLLLFTGLGAGVFAALVAVLPHWFVGGASIPVSTLTVTLILVLAAGLASALFAMRTTLRAPLVSALRGE